ncbi:MAG: hypothetical protein NC400_08820 [Clostridium sp.]|nr:hypothetical protein [Clostridium sp.]
MAWCPRCKSEYVEGITICADCGCELVEVLPEEKAGGREDVESFIKISDVIRIQPDVIPLAAQALKEKRSAEQEQDFGKEGFQGKGLQKESFQKESFREGEFQEESPAKENFPEDDFQFEEEAPRPKYQPVYVNNEEKAEENKTSGYTLLTVGGIGFIAMILVFFDVIDIGVLRTNKYIITGVMGVLFILFIIMGIISMRNSRVFKKKAVKENNLTTEIKRWCALNLERERIDSLLELEGVQEELQYFQRFDYMKKAIQKQFMNLDEAYLDRLVEEVYGEVFPENSAEALSDAAPEAFSGELAESFSDAASADSSEGFSEAAEEELP